jgi:hypothetical protein
MSIHRPVEIECPNCQRTQTVVVWESLNANVDPEAREQLLQGKINVFECEACGQSALIPASLLYHDMTRRFLAQFHSVDAIDNPNFLARFDSDGRDTHFADAAGDLPEDLGYMKNPHIVFTMGELVLYVLFRERLFDFQRHVNRFFVAGFHYHEGPRLIDQLAVGGTLRLVPEPDNPHDPGAVAIYHQADRVGYVPRERNAEIAEQIDRRVPLAGRITAVYPGAGPFEALEVEVALPARRASKPSRPPGGPD